MTTQEMQTALASGFNKQGRSVSLTMRVNYLYAVTRPKEQTEEDYRGMTIQGCAGTWTVTDKRIWPGRYTSNTTARAAVDACWALRAEVAAK